VKDGSVSSGLDRAFLDNVIFSNATAVFPGSISGSQLIVQGMFASTLQSQTPAQSYSNSINYQWQISTNGITWSNIGGASWLSYTPPTPVTTTYYRRRVQDACGRTAYSNIDTITVLPYVATTNPTETSVGYITYSG